MRDLRLSRRRFWRLQSAGMWRRVVSLYRYLTIRSHLRPLTSGYDTILKMGAEDLSETQISTTYMAVHPRRQWFPKTEIINKNHALRDFRLRCFGISRNVEWGFLADVSGQPVGSIFIGQRAALTFEDKTVTLSRNVSKKIPFYSACNPKTAQNFTDHKLSSNLHICFEMGKSQIQFFSSYEMKQRMSLTVQRTDGLNIMILSENGVKSCKGGDSELFQDRFIASVLYVVVRSFCRLSRLLATPTTRCFFCNRHVKLVLWRLLIRSDPIVRLRS